MKLRGKIKQRARILRGRTAQQHQTDTLVKMLGLDPAMDWTKKELDEAFADAFKRREQERKEIASARAEGRIYKIEDFGDD